MQVIVSESGIRVDKYLASVTDYSREVITDMINEDYVSVNGKKIKPSYKVSEGDVVDILDGFIKDVSVVPKKMDLDIVYEDDDLIVINKPSGLTVHPGAGNYDNTLVNGLMHYTSSLSDGDIRPGIVHRLDKDTSGLMIVAKNNKAAEILSEGFKNKTIHREYIAIVDGIFPQEEAIIDAPIKRSSENFNKMCVSRDGKRAVTHVSVIKRYKDYTLVRLVLETGRTHQIRVHLSSIGYPILNDPVYNNKKANEFGQFLHSEYLKFNHPITGEELEFRRKAPKEFDDFIDSLENK